MNEQHKIDLETKIAYQEHNLQELSDVIFRQQQQIDKLESIIQLLIKRFDEFSAAQPGNSAPADEKPPHY